MDRRILLSCTALALLIAIRPAEAAAQTTSDQVLYACYIPAVGVVYRIKAPGLPSACLGRNHIEFSWNAQGPKGDRGEAGPAGNLALAGQDCPSGFWLAGFTATGALRCRNLAGQEPAEPPPPPNPFSGNWTFAPNFTSRCTSILGNGSRTLTGMTTSVSAANQLILDLRGSYEFQGAGGPLTSGRLAIPLSDPPTFPIEVAAQATATFTGPLLFGTVTYAVFGQFSSLTSFSGSVQAPSSTLIARVLGLPNDVTVSCAPVFGNFTATREP